MVEVIEEIYVKEKKQVIYAREMLQAVRAIIKGGLTSSPKLEHYCCYADVWRTKRDGLSAAHSVEY